MQLKKILLLIVTITLLAPPLFAADRDRRGNMIKSGEPKTFTKSEVLPGGIHIDFKIVTLANYKKEVNEVFKYTFSETKRVAKLLDVNDPTGDASKVVAQAGVEPVVVGKELIVIAEHAKNVSDWTRGAFDIVTGPGNYRNLKVDKKNSTVYLTKKGSALDLRGIIDGYIADLFIRAAYHASIDHAIVTVNGVSRSMGQDATTPWRIPLTGEGTQYAKHGLAVVISNYSAATSGGRHYSPFTDPRTGAQVNNPFHSVTVLCKQAGTAQAVATGVYVMGPELGETVINGLGIRAIFHTTDGKMTKVGRWQ